MGLTTSLILYFSAAFLNFGRIVKRSVSAYSLDCRLANDPAVFIKELLSQPLGRLDVGNYSEISPAFVFSIYNPSFLQVSQGGSLLLHLYPHNNLVK